MSRKKTGKKDGNQIVFQFTVDPADLMQLEGGSQEALSDFEFRLRQTVKAVLDDVSKRPADPLDRIEVAARMSRKLGREITKTHIDQWTAMATVQRRIHVDALKALCEVTGDMRPLHYIVESFGLKALTADEALLAEYGAKVFLQKKLASETKSILNAADEERLTRTLIGRMTGGE